MKRTEVLLSLTALTVSLRLPDDFAITASNDVSGTRTRRSAWLECFVNNPLV